MYFAYATCGLIINHRSATLNYRSFCMCLFFSSSLSLSLTLNSLAIPYILFAVRAIVWASAYSWVVDEDVIDLIYLTSLQRKIVTSQSIIVFSLHFVDMCVCVCASAGDAIRRETYSFVAYRLI